MHKHGPSALLATFLAVMLVVPQHAWAYGQDAQQDWAAVRQIRPGTSVAVGLRTGGIAEGLLVFADDSMLVLAVPGGARLAGRVKNAIESVGPDWSAVLQGKIIEVQDGIGDKAVTRVTRDGFFAVNARIGSLVLIKREDLQQINQGVKAAWGNPRGDWVTVRSMDPGTAVSVTRTDGPTIEALFAFADDSMVLLAVPSDRGQSQRIKEAVVAIGPNWPGVLQGRPRSFRDNPDDTRGFTVTRDGFFAGDANVGSLLRLPRQAVVRVSVPARRGHPWLGAAIGAATGLVVLGVAAFVSTATVEPCRDSCAGQRLAMYGAFSLPFVLGYAGYKAGRGDDGIIYQAAPTAAGAADGFGELNAATWEQIRAILPPSLHPSASAGPANVTPKPKW